MSTAVFPTLPYQSRVDPHSPPGRWLGITSCLCWLGTMAYIAVCLTVAFQVTASWEQRLGWVLFALIGSWVGCVIGAAFGLAGAFPARRRHRFATVGSILNLLTGLGPVLFALLINIG